MRPIDVEVIYNAFVEKIAVSKISKHYERPKLNKVEKYGCLDQTESLIL